LRELLDRLVSVRCDADNGKARRYKNQPNGFGYQGMIVHQQNRISGSRRLPVIV
jgi:hypothetical protein